MTELPIRIFSGNADDSYHQLFQFDSESIAAILNGIDALVYVSDMHTHELIFVNSYGQKHWGATLGKKCYQYLQFNQEQPCSFCTNHQLLDADGKPSGVHVWDFQNTVTQRWYQCRDQAIKWVDGRYVRIEIAVDITDNKLAMQQLELERSHAEELARLDPLTKIYNRRAFFEHISRQFSYLKRNLQSLSLVMIDVDHFKKVNDQYGHAIGDQALIAITKTVQDGIRECDLLFRIGGEEFVLLLQDCDEASAFFLIERIRNKIEAIQLHSHDRQVDLTCSFGITQYWSTSSIDSMIAEADRALYFAKKNGRNRSILFSQMQNKAFNSEVKSVKESDGYLSSSRLR